MKLSTRQRVVGAVVAAVVLLGALVLWRTLRRPRVAPGRLVTQRLAQAAKQLAAVGSNGAIGGRGGAVPQATRLAVTPTATPGPAGSPTPTPHLGGLAQLVRQAAADYRRRARYPSWSHPIRAGEEDPILRDRQVSPNVSRGADGQDPALIVLPDKVSFESPDPVVIYAYLSDNGSRVPARSINGTVTDQQGAAVATLDFGDDGRNGDAQAGDAIYTAMLQPSDTGAGRLNGSYAIRVDVFTTDGRERIGTSGFLYSNPDAQLTGRYSDAVVNGSLQIQAEVSVTAAGRFHLAASLYSRAGQPLAWAQNALALEPGTHWIPLSFYGLILHEQGVPGPYVLHEVALSTTTVMPNPMNRLVQDAYVTRAYPVTAFSDKPFNDQTLLDSANRLQHDTRPQGLNLDAGSGQ